MLSEAAQTVDESRRFELPARLDIRAAAPLKETLAALLSTGQPAVLDVGSIQQMSTACVQVLAAFSIASENIGRPVTIARPTQEFLDAFRSLGLGELTEAWTVES